MSMERIITVNVGWSGNNFCAGWTHDMLGTVAVTAKTMQQLMNDFTQSLRWHIEGCVADGDEVPQWLADGAYRIDFCPDTAALLQNAGAYTTLAAISRASGINQKQLSHYANGIKKPREQQRERIIMGLHDIGAQIMALR